MQILEKRTSESARYDIDCSILLSPGETIASVTSISATPTGSPLVFGSPLINTVPLTYTDTFGSARTVGVGVVIQVQISGGAIPTNQRVQIYTVRAVFATNLNPAIEATVRLRLNDTPAL